MSNNEKTSYSGEETEFNDPKGGGKLLSNDRTLFSNDSGFVLWKVQFGYSLNEDDIKKLLDGKETELISEFQKKSGGNFSAKLKLNNDFKIELVFENKEFPSNSIGLNDPRGGEIFENDKTFTNKDLKYTIWKDISGHKLTKDELKKLLNGETIGPFDDFYSKKKEKKFETSLKFNKDENKIEFSF